MTWGRIGTIHRGLPTLFAEGRKRRPDPFDRSRERQALEPPNPGPDRTRSVVQGTHADNSSMWARNSQCGSSVTDLYGLETISRP
jgi:hypothetical protein